jgi:hypothetical protein
MLESYHERRVDKVLICGAGSIHRLAPWRSCEDDRDSACTGEQVHSARLRGMPGLEHDQLGGDFYPLAVCAFIGTLLGLVVHTNFLEVDHGFCLSPVQLHLNFCMSPRWLGRVFP